MSPLDTSHLHIDSVFGEGGEYRTVEPSNSLSPKINLLSLSTHPNCVRIISASS